MDPFLKMSIFDSNGLIYYVNPEDLFTSETEYTGKLIVIKDAQDSQGRHYIYCKSLGKNLKIYIYKPHFTSYIVDGTLRFIRKI